MTVFTIGHSNHSIEIFISLLKQYGVTAIADVRSSPYSRRFPQFNQAAFKAALKTANIAYVYLGDRLGARPQDQSCYVDGMARYDLIAASEAFAEGLNRLAKGAEKYQISLMCAEQDPIVCHRAILVCPHLQKIGLEIQHIRKNGELETHQCLEARLLKLHHLDKLLPLSPESHKESQRGTQLSLFDMNAYETNAQQVDQISTPLSHEELLEKAYQLQGERIAYVEEKHTDQEQVNEQVS
ncbi:MULTISPECIES: DUF488 family protein [unclassified Anabaena]|uniref:DUF488 domain-containing protein n=1 Tax=unclassified Anabaena TaxID=2619674 RepID=UPI00082EC7A1|nr:MULTISPECIES: DUF488 domain-containing protein [unclassified Anabaena]